MSSKNIMEIMEYIQDQVQDNSTRISETIISPPEMSLYWYKKSSFPLLHLWENGYTPIANSVQLQGKLRRYTLNNMLIVKNQVSEKMSNAYKELVTVQRELSGIVNDLSAQGAFILKSQSASGTRPLQQKGVNFYLLMRVITYQIECMEIT